MLSSRSDKNRLARIVQLEIKHTGINLTDDGLEELMNYVERGASTLNERISRLHRSESVRFTREAERNLHQIMGALVASTGEEPINAQTVRRVMAGICPIWPFC